LRFADEMAEMASEYECRKAWRRRCSMGVALGLCAVQLAASVVEMSRARASRGAALRWSTVSPALAAIGAGTLVALELRAQESS